MQICEHCGKNYANVTIRENIDGATRELHLCSECAAALGFGGSFVPTGLISSIFSSSAAAPRQRQREKTCPVCGTSFSEYARTGLVGCENCYKVFRSELIPVLVKMHGKTRHEGKVPVRGGEDHALLREYKELTAEKEQALVEERFDDAEQIAARLKELSEELRKKGLK